MAFKFAKYWSPLHAAPRYDGSFSVNDDYSKKYKISSGKLPCHRLLDSISCFENLEIDFKLLLARQFLTRNSE